MLWCCCVVLLVMLDNGKGVIVNVFLVVICGVNCVFYVVVKGGVNVLIVLFVFEYV